MSKKNKDLIRRIILIISLPVFFISLISVYTGVNEYYKNNKLYNAIDNLNPFKNNDLSIAYTKLKELNEDYVGWLYIPGTKVNYPIVKCTDNLFYLNHNFLKEESKAGSIFSDYSINEFEDKNTIIYGHYMKDGSMFADLHKIYSELDNTLKIYIATENNIAEYELFSAFKDSADINNYQIFWSTTENYLAFIDNIISKSVVNFNLVINESDKILTLSTCDFNSENGRLLIFFRLLELP